MSQPEWTPKVGDGATICHHSDRTACTVVRVSPSGITIWMRRDIATLDGWKPKIVPGGFAGHCVNNDCQRYTYRPDPDGTMHRARRLANGSYLTPGSERVIPGRHHFHDYNF
jgi:hypothetical protein